MTLRDKVVVVAGAARGVCRYVAGAFARAGCRLAIPEIDAERMAVTAGELGAEVLTSTVDVTDESAISTFMDHLYQHYGRLDVLVNNAGIVSHRHWAITGRLCGRWTGASGRRLSIRTSVVFSSAPSTRSGTCGRPAWAMFSTSGEASAAMWWATPTALAAEAGMELTGEVVDLDDSGRLVAVNTAW